MQPGPGQSSAETVYLQESGVTVTSARVQIGRDTYPLQGITAVRQATKPADRAAWILVALIGVICALSSSCFWSGGVAIAAVLLVVGAAIITLGVVYASRAKATQILQLHTAGGQFEAVKSQDESHIARVTNAIVNALAARRP